MNDPKTDELPDFPKPDRLMSSVMSMAQDAVDRVEQYRAGVEQMLAHEDAGGDGWWKGWSMLKAVYAEEKANDWGPAA